jgi:hypothetical protein
MVEVNNVLMELEEAVDFITRYTLAHRLSGATQAHPAEPSGAGRERHS